MTRICRKCNIEKPLEEFTKHKRMKLGYDTICLECNRKVASKWNEDNPEKYKLKCKRWYRGNAEYVKKRNYNRKEDILNLILEYKKDKKCSNCGYDKNIEVLQFHHKDKKEKNFTIAEAASSHISNENLFKEIEKCILLCPNCHYEFHNLENKQNKRASI